MHKTVIKVAGTRVCEFKKQQQQTQRQQYNT